MVTTADRQEFSDRFNEALDDADVPLKFQGRQQAVVNLFRADFSVTQNGARKWLEGKAIPHTKRLPVIAKRLNVRAEWLLSGRGPKREGKADYDLIVDCSRLSESQAEGLRRLKCLLESGQLDSDRFAALLMLADTPEPPTLGAGLSPEGRDALRALADARRAGTLTDEQLVAMARALIPAAPAR